MTTYAQMYAVRYINIIYYENLKKVARLDFQKGGIYTSAIEMVELMVLFLQLIVLHLRKCTRNEFKCRVA